MNGFKRNLGLRIDHILVSPELALRCRASSIDHPSHGDWSVHRTMRGDGRAAALVAYIGSAAGEK